MERMNVEVVCTTDDPIDDLKYHAQIRQSALKTKVLPAWRPDKAMAIENVDTYNEYLTKLEAAADMSILNFKNLIDALQKRHDFFASQGCSLSDHGLTTFYAEPYTDAEIEAILTVLPDLTKWANEIEAYALDAALNHGKEWTGFKVVEGRSVRKYRDEAKVAEAAKEAGYTDIYRQSLIPMTEMEKLMGKTEFEEVLGSLIYKPPGKPTLVPETDKRPAINVTNAINEFNEI